MPHSVFSLGLGEKMAELQGGSHLGPRLWLEECHGFGKEHGQVSGPAAETQMPLECILRGNSPSVSCSRPGPSGETPRAAEARVVLQVSPPYLPPRPWESA